MMRELIHVSKKDLQILTRELQIAFSAWFAHWVGDALPAHIDEEHPVSLTVASQEDVLQTTWMPLASGTMGIWNACQHSVAHIACLMFRGEPSKPYGDADWGKQLAQDALGDLTSRLIGTLGTSSTEAHAPTPSHLPFSGMLLMRVPALHINWLLSRKAYAALLKPAAAANGKCAQPITPLLTALQRHSVSVSIGLGHAEVPIDDLMSLRQGDVIPFPAKLADALPVLIEQQATHLKANLGAQGLHRAVKLTLPRPASAQPLLATKVF